MKPSQELKDIINRTYTEDLHARAVEHEAHFLTRRHVPRAEFLSFNNNLINKMTPEEVAVYLSIARAVGRLQMVDAECMTSWATDAFFFDRNSVPQ